MPSIRWRATRLSHGRQYDYIDLLEHRLDVAAYFPNALQRLNVLHSAQVAESQGRRWLAFELSREYVGTSAFRFLDKRNSHADMREIFDRIEAGQMVDLNDYLIQGDLLPAATGS